jgi:mono/diheme cytochrome c family protein
MCCLYGRTSASLLIGVCLMAALLLGGCKKKSAPSTAQSVPPGGGPNFSPPESDDPALSGPYAAGRKVFEAQGCTRCHSVGGRGGPAGGGWPMAGGPGPGGPGGPGGPNGPGPMPGGPGPGGMGRGLGGMARGPDLGHVGAKPEHTPQWLAEHVRNPRAHKPNSKMPPFGENKINEADMRALTDYLASLK